MEYKTRYVRVQFSRIYVNTPNKFSVIDGPGNRQLFKDGLFPVFELVS